jgi:GAF domain-containing protein
VRERERLLAQVFVRLSDTLVDDFDVVEFLQGLSADAVSVLNAAAAGVMLADGRGGVRLVASSEERMRVLELFEIQHDQGPCLDALHTGATITATAAEGLLRWPAFAPIAADDGFRFMCAVPLKLRNNVIGALNLFRGTDDAFTDGELTVARALGQVAATGLLQQRTITERHLLAEQLQAALNSRVIIEQAKGMLAEALSITVEEAFQALRGRARDTNRKLTDVARDITDRRTASQAFLSGGRRP